MLKKNLNSTLLTSLYLTVTPLFVSSILVLAIIQREALFSALNLWEWFGITLLFTFTSMVALTPPSLLALIYGYFLGWIALPYLFFLNMAAIYLVNSMATKMTKNRFIETLAKSPKAIHLLENIRKEEFKIILWAKLSPVLPFALTNYIFAISKAKQKNILWGGFLGMVPRTVLAVWTGVQANEIKTLLEHPNQGSMQQISIIVLVVVSILGVAWAVQKAMKK